MKIKQGIFIFLFLCISTFANSQILIGILFGDKLNTDKMSMGFAVGDNYSSFTNIKNAQYSHNLTFGLYFYIKGTERLSFHPNLFFSAPFSANDAERVPTGDPNLDTLLQNTDAVLKTSNFSLPFMLNYKVWKGFSIELGPIFSLMRKATKTYSIKSNSSTLVYTAEITSDMYRFDYGVTGGLNYGFRQGKGIKLNVRYNRGFRDLIRSDARSEIASIAEGNVNVYFWQFLVEIPIAGNKKNTNPPIDTEN